jgi:hypothetical protein
VGARVHALQGGSSDSIELQYVTSVTGRCLMPKAYGSAGQDGFRADLSLFSDDVGVRFRADRSFIGSNGDFAPIAHRLPSGERIATGFSRPRSGE